jgi:hypothetical protein
MTARTHSWFSSPLIRTVATVGVAAAFVGTVAFVAATQPGGRSPAVDGPLGGRAAPRATPTGASKPDVNPELQEGAEIAAERQEAYAEAKAAGRVGQVRPTGAAATAPATGWAGERPVDTVADDWEPALAADPTQPYVYTLVTRYGSAKPCPGNCPTPYHALYTSSDGGATFDGGKPLCACKGSGQFDPIIEVVPGTHAVYAAYMNGFNVLFTKSTDHGQTWSAPAKVYGNVSWNDKPTLAVSDNGQDVYISFNGPTGGDPWMAQSHDAGATWTQTKLVDSSYYYFDFDSDVAADGTVYFAETALLYGGGGNKGTFPSAPIEEHVFISRDRGATWENRTIATVQPGTVCVAAGCTPDYYLGHIALSADASGKLVVLYDGATTPQGLQSISSRTSSDGGRTWSAAQLISAAGETSDAPAVESRRSGDVRAWYYQTSGGGNVDAWNVWYRSSTNGGSTWSAPVKISDAGAVTSYKTASGFAEVYGDYGEVGITSAGKTVAIWGEGASYSGPGGAWFNRQL